MLRLHRLFLFEKKFGDDEKHSEVMGRIENNRKATKKESLS